MDTTARFAALVLAAAATAGCASGAPKNEVVQVATPETVAQLRADQLETEQVRRYMAKKQMCRNMAIRWDSSGRCW